jgi:hypothetical protein
MAEFGLTDKKVTFGESDVKETFGQDDKRDESFLDRAGTALWEGTKAIPAGIHDAARSAIGLVEPAAKYMESKVPLGSLNIDPRSEDFGWSPEYKPWELPTVKPSENAGANLSRGIARFLTGFIPGLKGARNAGIAPAVQKMAPGKTGRVLATAAEAEVAAQIADQTVFGPHEKRLSNLIQEFPQLQNPVTDSESEARFKVALEGLGLGLVMTPFVEALRLAKNAGVKIGSKVVPKGAVKKVVEEAVPKAGRFPSTRTKFDEAVLYQGVRESAGADKRIVSEYWTSDLSTARAFGGREGGGKVRVALKC